MCNRSTLHITKFFLTDLHVSSSTCAFYSITSLYHFFCESNYFRIIFWGNISWLNWFRLSDYKDGIKFYLKRKKKGYFDPGIKIQPPAGRSGCIFMSWLCPWLECLLSFHIDRQLKKKSLFSYCWSNHRLPTRCGPRGLPLVGSSCVGQIRLLAIRFVAF